MRPRPAQLVDFFARSLTAFQSSQDPLRVLCTLPHGLAAAASTTAAAAAAGSSAGDAEPAPRRPTSGPVRRLIVLDSSFNPPTRAHARMVRSAVQDAKSRSTSRDPRAARDATTRVMLLLAVNNADKAPKPASFPVRLCMMEGFARELLGGDDEEGVSTPPGVGEKEQDTSRRRRQDAAAGLEVDLAVTTMPYFHDKERAIDASGFYGRGGDEAPEQVFLAGYDTLIRIFNPKYYHDHQDHDHHDGDGSQEASGAASAAGGHAKQQQKKTAMQRALDPFFATARLRVSTRLDDEWGGLEEQREYVRGLEGGRLDAVGGRGAWARRVDVVSTMDGDDDDEAGGEEEEEMMRRMEGVSSSKAREAVKERDGEGLERLVDGEVRAWIEREKLYRD
ncbi:Nicotinamide-nucleotide adenylyltransferase [Purpureocillium takamizusanense]|uniref:Nicotinamide-nucleotide adenylyltransferase n=1 Tax=Purpureocillium takamizusanense TaxID=2060973 RepID=A0A9Q8VGG4_9HYPO|nr:Nicotinamide-nucleotide adenylyltransferase [Purpureocillium takamizusanense]UNI24618.1 Nicotinamide-nucleotide adenylyltransferase [Purpureocillium takamizusanense]